MPPARRSSGICPEWIAEAHLVIGRGGATTIAELTALGRPSVLIPLPHSVDNDQLFNATRLADAGAAWCIEQKDLTPERLTDGLVGVFSSTEELASAAEAAHALGRPDAVYNLADLVEELVGGNS